LCPSIANDYFNFHPTKSVIDNTAIIMYDGKSVSRTNIPRVA
jgi:hypothetical protein